MPEEFELFTEEEKQDVAYKACVLGITAVGASLGGLAGGQVILGGAGGLVWGLLTCPKLSYPIKKKLFSSNQKFTEQEVASLVSEIRRQKFLGKSNAIKALAQVRVELSKHPQNYKKLLVV